MVIGYGLTERIDVHGYYAHQNDGKDNYYYGLFYQFIDSKYIDLATAVGRRHYTESEVNDLFFPQLLFNFKLGNDFTIGGALVNIKRITSNSLKTQGSAFDIAMYIPLSNEISLPKFIREIKLAFGVFNPGVFDSDHGKFLPTYSIDVTFKRIRFSN